MLSIKPLEIGKPKKAVYNKDKTKYKSTYKMTKEEAEKHFDKFCASMFVLVMTSLLPDEYDEQLGNIHSYLCNNKDKEIKRIQTLNLFKF